MAAPTAENPYASPSSTGDAPAEPSRGSLFVLFLVVFIDLLGFGMVLPLLPNYATQFFGPDTTYSKQEQGLILGLLMSSFSIMQFLVSPLWGRLSDRIGRRPVLIVGLLGSVVFYALFALASIWENFALLFVARIGAGVAGATISTAQAYIADCTTLKGRTKGMALIGAAFGLGFTFGPLFGYFAVSSRTDSPGPGPGYVASGLSAVALVLAIFVLKESLTGEQRAAFRRPRGGWWTPETWRATFAVPSMATLFFATFVCVFAFANFESTLSLLLGERSDRIADTDTPGFAFGFKKILLVFSYIGFSLLIAQGFLVRRLAGKISDQAFVSIGTVMQVVGFGLLIWAIQAVSEPALFVSLTLVTVGFACITPALNALISRRSDPAEQGRVLGLAQSVNSLGASRGRSPATCC
ncbi:MAG: MFS transporter [Pirellulales bacterium]